MTAVQEVEAWYVRFGEKVFRRCRRLAGDEATAWDLTQDVFLQAHRHQADFRGDSAPLSWLLSIADRAFLQHLRKSKRVPVPSGLVEFVEEEAEASEEAFSRYQLVNFLLRRCPRKTQQIVIHRYFDELTYEQIGLQLGLAEKTVRRRHEKFLNGARKLTRLRA